MTKNEFIKNSEIGEYVCLPDPYVRVFRVCYKCGYENQMEQKLSKRLSYFGYCRQCHINFHDLGKPYQSSADSGREGKND